MLIPWRVAVWYPDGNSAADGGAKFPPNPPPMMLCKSSALGTIHPSERIDGDGESPLPSERWRFVKDHDPIGSMYGIFTYIYHTNQLNVGEYTSPMDPMGD